MYSEQHPGRLDSRPDEPTLTPPIADPPHRLSDGRTRAVIYAPPRTHGASAAPLLVMLHGAAGDPEQSLHLIEAPARAAGAIVIAPAAEARSWDVITHRRFGADVRNLDAALTWVFDRYTIDPQRIAIGGFSDGASYALSLALTNGDLFTHAVAFSPGSMAPSVRVGRPAVFMSHGVTDDVLPIGACSRRLAPELRRNSYPLEYVEFPGGHVAPEAIVDRAFRWWLSMAID